MGSKKTLLLPFLGYILYLSLAAGVFLVLERPAEVI